MVLQDGSQFGSVRPALLTEHAAVVQLVHQCASWVGGAPDLCVSASMLQCWADMQSAVQPQQVQVA